MNNKSLDDMNIWGLYDRNSRYYYTCKDISKCPTKEDTNECLCHHKQIVVPQDIGEWWVHNKNNWNRRIYIQIGSKCSICLSSINKKSDAWITNCGHSFHRSCLMESYRIYENNTNIIHYTNCMPCPICRADLPTCCCGFDFSRYQKVYGKRRNELDNLENFYAFFDIANPIECYKCKKNIGMNNACKSCTDYQKNGHEWMKYFRD